MVMVTVMVMVMISVMRVNSPQQATELTWPLTLKCGQPFVTKSFVRGWKWGVSVRSLCEVCGDCEFNFGFGVGTNIDVDINAINSTMSTCDAPHFLVLKTLERVD